MHRKKLENIYEEFHSGPEGLKNDQAKENLRLYGQNQIKTKQKKPIIISFLEEFFDLMVIILIIAGTIAYAFKETTDAIVIFGIVLLNATVSFIQKHKAENAVAALQKMVAPKARVIRNGQQIVIEAHQVVPGDIIILSPGTIISADARLVEANQLECNQAILTGESEAVPKTVITLKGKNVPKIEHSNTVFMGTVITSGTGKAIVFATGEKTEFGKIAQLTTTTKQDPTPLQKEMKRIGGFIAILTLVLSGTLLFIGYFIQGKGFIENLLFTISVAVAAVPEGLPTTITIALAIGVRRLATKKAIVKKLTSVETLGCATVILSDKTGTLTQNELTIKELYFNNLFTEVKGIGYSPRGEVQILKPDSGPITIGRDDPVLVDMGKRKEDLKFLEEKEKTIYETLKTIALVGSLCSNSTLKQTSDNEFNVVGDPLEGAILTFIKKCGFDSRSFENQYKYLEKIPFNPERKRMSVVVRHIQNGEIFVLTKGSVKTVLEKCTGILIDGKKIDLTKELRDKIDEKTKNMADNALRVIAFAYREMPRKEKEIYTEAATENNLTLLGLAGMIDPPRRDVKEAIALTKEAGIRTYIVTGDNGFTATAIAKQIGLITSEKCEIITGEDLNKISEEKLEKLLRNKEKEIIFASVSPQHKVKITNALKNIGEIVAVTGDGVNDAPALKRADIGIAMGIKGSDVSKEAATMVLADDSFTSIVRAIEEGRTIYQNMKKFIFYIFSCNIGELLIIFTAIIAQIPTPLTAVLILVVNVGTDILPAMALGIEPSGKDVMSAPPRKKNKKIINKHFIGRVTYIGGIIGTIVLSVFIWNLYRYGWEFGEKIDTSSIAYIKSITMAFATLVSIQLFNAYNARSNNHSIFSVGILRNPYIIGSILISFSLLYIITELPILQKYLGVMHLTGTEWGIIFITGVSILAIEEIRKLIVKFKD